MARASASFVILCLLVAVMPSAARAATLSFTNASGAVGQTVSVSVLVSAAAGESLNGVSARVNFPTDKLTLLSLSKAGSIITFWAEEPTFSNSAGTASLEGIVPNPGFSGQGGRVITLVFQVKAPGTATVSFGNASVLANDGRGTDILTSASSRTLTLSAGAPGAPDPIPAPTPARPVTQPGQPQAPGTEAPAPEMRDEDATTTDPGPAGITVPAGSRAPALSAPALFIPIAVLMVIALLAALVIRHLLTRARIARQHGLAADDRLVRRSFALLRHDLTKHVATLRGHVAEPLTEKEVAFLEQFEADLGEVESLVEKKLGWKEGRSVSESCPQQS